MSLFQGTFLPHYDVMWALEYPHPFVPLRCLWLGIQLPVRRYLDKFIN